MTIQRILCCAVLLAGCAHFDGDDAPAASIDGANIASSDYVFPALAAPAGGQAPVSPWFETAVPADLGALLSRAEEDSPAIGIGARRLQQAEANLKAAEASRWVDIVFSGSASADYDVEDGSDSSSGRFGLGLDLPLDVTGRLRTLRDAARYDLYSAQAAFDATRNQTLRDLSLSVVDAAEAAQLTALIEEQIETSRTLLRLTELRFAQGQASIVDVLQQRDQIASLEQQLPPLRTSRLDAIDRIATATGTPPVADDMPALLSQIPVIGLPGAYPAANTLMTSRPDLRAAAWDLQSADASYTAALLSRLPSFSLSADAVTQLASGNSSEFISATVSGAMPVFRSGATSAAIELSRAQAEQSSIALLQSWLGALAEINGLIAQESEGRENIRLTEERLETARELLESARRRYRQGASDYLPVLNALQSIQTQERRLLSLTASQARIRLRLNAALGLPAGDTDMMRSI